MSEEKKQPAKRIQLVDVVLERKGSQLFEGRRVRSPEDAVSIINDFVGLNNSPHEVFVALFLSVKNEPNMIQVISQGSLNASIIHPREVMKVGIISNAASIIVAHCHPSNDVTPSPEDIDVTSRLKQVGELVGIELLDHLIIGFDKHLSLKEKGYM